MPIFAILGSRLAGYIGIGLSVVLGLALVRAEFQVWSRGREITSLGAKIEEANGTIATLTSDKAQCLVNTASLRTSLETQNAAVAALKTEGDAATARANAAVARARSASNTARALGDMIAARLPPPGVDACVAALDEARRPDQ